MGHDKLRKFAENETFHCLLQPSSKDLLADGYFSLRDHEIKGRWNEKMFDAARPIVVELGCGKGEYTVDLAVRNPECNYIGVDIKGARLWKGAKYAHENKMGNVAFLRTKIEFIEAFFAPGEVSEIWLTFSDPQHKSENARLTSPLFIERYRKFLKPGGVVHLKTDSRFLHEYTKALCAENSLKVLDCTHDLYGEEHLPKPELYEVQTFYERMFLDQGYKITYMSFNVDGDAPVVSPEKSGRFDSDYWRSVEGPRQLFGRDTAETRRLKLHSEESGK